LTYRFWFHLLVYGEVQVLAFLGILVAINLIPNSEYRPLVTFLVTQQNPNIVSGHVTDDRQNPVSDVRVELLNEVDTVIQAVKTNGSGLFVFRILRGKTELRFPSSLVVN
jgi:hypothetical protein